MAEENPNNTIVRDGDTEFSGAEYWSAVGNLPQPDAAQNGREFAERLWKVGLDSWTGDTPTADAIAAIERILAEKNR